MASGKKRKKSGDCYAIGEVLDTAHDVGQISGTALFGLHGAEPVIYDDYVVTTNQTDFLTALVHIGADWSDQGSKQHYVDRLVRSNRHVSAAVLMKERMPWPDILTSNGVSEKAAAGQALNLLRSLGRLRGNIPAPAPLRRGRYEYYEIKPDSPTGLAAGEKKLERIQKIYNKYGIREKPGDFYPDGGAKEIPLEFNSSFIVLACIFLLRHSISSVSIYLKVRRATAGLLVYKLCVEIETEDERKQQALAKAAAKHLAAAFVVTSSKLKLEPLLKELGDHSFEGDRLPRIRCAFDVIDELKPWTKRLEEALYMRGLAFPGDVWQLWCDEAFYQSLVAPPYFGPTVDSLWEKLRTRAEAWAGYFGGSTLVGQLQTHVIFRIEEIARMADRAHPGLKEFANAVLRWMTEHKAATIAIVLIPLVVTAGVAVIIEGGLLAGALMAGELGAAEGAGLAVAGNVGRIAMTETVASTALSADVAAVSAFRGFQTVAQVAAQIGGTGVAANTNAIASALPSVVSTVRTISAAAAGITLLTMSTQARADTGSGSGTPPAGGGSATPAAPAVPAAEPIAQHTSGLFMLRPAPTPSHPTRNIPIKGESTNLHYFADVKRPILQPELPAPVSARYLGKVTVS